MNGFANFDEIPSMILEVIKKTKRYGHTVSRTVGRSDNVKTVYPPTNTVCGGIISLLCLYQAKMAGERLQEHWSSTLYNFFNEP